MSPEFERDQVILLVVVEIMIAVSVLTDLLAFERFGVGLRRPHRLHVAATAANGLIQIRLRHTWINHARCPLGVGQRPAERSNHVRIVTVSESGQGESRCQKGSGHSLEDHRRIH